MEMRWRYMAIAYVNQCQNIYQPQRWSELEAKRIYLHSLEGTAVPSTHYSDEG